jgi:hypothetical protein
MRSPAPERFSLAFSVVDFWESGVTARLLVYRRVDEARVMRLTLLRGLLAETLAEVVRHVDLLWWGCLVWKW